jgi:hypothetical protein
MSLVFSTSPELRVSLDPVRTEDRVPSVAFDLLIEVAMPFQTARITSKERWFTHEALNKFENELLTLRSAEHGSAVLQDMSERPVLRVMRQGNEVTTTVRTEDTTQMVVTAVESRGYASELEALHEQLRSYEKWW